MYLYMQLLEYYIGMQSSSTKITSAQLRTWQWKIPFPLLQQKLCCTEKLYYGGKNHVCSSGIIVTKEENPTV